MKKKEYTPEYRVEAARIVCETGKSVPQVARDLGINSNTLWTWVKNVQRQDSGSDSASLSVEEQARLRLLERENRELRMERDFLKKAAAFFAKNQL